MRLFRTLLGQAEARVKHKYYYYDYDAAHAQFRKKATSYWDVVKDFRLYWLVVPTIWMLNYSQYKYDCEAVDMVRYNVKLYPNKPEVRRVRM